MTASVRALQARLQRQGAAIAVDGVIGPQTLLAAHEFYAFAAEVADFPADFAWDYVTWDEIRYVMSIMTREMYVNVSFLNVMIKTENYHDTMGVLIKNEGYARGIAQFTEATWSKVTGSDWNESRDVGASLRAAMRLYMANRSVHANSFPGVVFSDAVAYLYHNQGAPGASKFLRSGKFVYPKQSDDALALMRSTRLSYESNEKSGIIPSFVRAFRRGV